MRTIASALLSVLLVPPMLAAQIRVNPSGVNVNTHAPTTVFLTFGGLQNYVPVEAVWCGSLQPAAPDVGTRCDPATVFGRLPLRYERSRIGGTTFTDIMSIPASVARRAYESAVAGNVSSFFYVRRFRSTTGGRDQYVAVTCRLAGGGARVPFALTHVALKFDVETPVMFVQPNQTLPSFAADITYNGTGTLRGRWEIVLPGDELPTSSDLLTEATLPPHERGLQKRYREIERFNVFVPPNGRVTLQGPDAARFPTGVEGQYLILLRIEASDDKEGDSNLASVGAGQGTLHNGAVAGFPMPTLRYVVGAGESRLEAAPAAQMIRLLGPAAAQEVRADSMLVLSWLEAAAARYYRVELQHAADGVSLFSAIVTADVRSYEVPPFVLAEAGSKQIRWRIIGLDAQGRSRQHSEWRVLQFSN